MFISTSVTDWFCDACETVRLNVLDCCVCGDQSMCNMRVWTWWQWPGPALRPRGPNYYFSILCYPLLLSIVANYDYFYFVNVDLNTYCLHYLHNLKVMQGREGWLALKPILYVYLRGINYSVHAIHVLLQCSISSHVLCEINVPIYRINSWVLFETLHEYNC